jgi:hypothetical protein
VRRPGVIAATAVFLISVGCCAFFTWRFESRRHGTTIPPREIYETLIADSIPDEVSELQAAGTTWQGYAIYLRFKAPSLDVAGFATPPYQPVDCGEILVYFELPDHIRSPFSPEWALPSPPQRTCLEAHDLRNDWTTLANHRVMYSGGWVLFVGFGT